MHIRNSNSSKCIILTNGVYNEWIQSTQCSTQRYTESMGGQCPHCHCSMYTQLITATKHSLSPNLTICIYNVFTRSSAIALLFAFYATAALEQFYDFFYFVDRGFFVISKNFCICVTVF